MSIGNEPAYSTTDSHDFKGLTKREMFAAMAMQAMIEAEYAKTLDKAVWASHAVECADALLAQLSKAPQP